MKPNPFPSLTGRKRAEELLKMSKMSSKHRQQRALNFLNERLQLLPMAVLPVIRIWTTVPLVAIDAQTESVFYS